MESANIHMQPHILSPEVGDERRLVTLARSLVGRGGRFWAVAGLFSLVLHVSLPMLGSGRTVVLDERVTIELVSVPAPVADVPIAPAPVEDTDESEVPRGPDAPPDAPLGAPPTPEAVATPETVSNPEPQPPDAPTPADDDVTPEEVADTEPEHDLPPLEPVVEQPRDATAEPEIEEPVLEKPLTESPVVEESAPPAKKFVRLPNLHRERGVPTRSVHPRVRRQPTKTRVASDAQRPGARGGKKAAPPAALKEGEPEDIWACEVGDRGIRAQVKKERPITDWVTLLPTALFAYPTTPSLTDYLGGVAQVTSRQRRHVPRVAKWEFAMPRGEVEVLLEEPLGVRAYLGRDDARCLVGFESTKTDFFPMMLKRVPVRIVDGEGNEVRILADLRFHKDARFELIARSDDDKVPFEEGRLENASLIERTVDAHMGTAKTFSSVASFFGFDVEKMMVAEQKRRMKALRTREAQMKAASTAPVGHARR